MNFAHIIKRRSRLIACLLGVPIVAGVGYYFTNPKAIVMNPSGTAYEELIISLPSSRISFSPIEAGSSSTIFYSHQNQSGESSYSLTSTAGEVTDGNFFYAEGSELGRVIRFTIGSDGRVTVSD